MTRILQGPNYTIYVLLVSMSLNFQSVFVASRFWITCHFEKGTPNDPRMTLNPARSIAPHIWVTSIHESKSSFSFVLWPVVSRYRHFEIGAPNDPKWSWTLPRHMYPICMTSVPQAQISVLSALRPDVLELHSILRESAPNDPKWPWTLKG